MNLEPIVQSEVSQKEKDEYNIKCNLQIQYDLYQIANDIFHRTRTK